ncbi:MAG: SWIM zinc finger domain-containing protein [Eubacterium sp.]|nr:SWIM zinc finger domain-containing protein [Eubacterium sp.]
MSSIYENLLSETREKIKEIRRESLRRITEVQNNALKQVKQDFSLLGWGKFWDLKQLTEDGQFERFEQSVVDTSLRLIEVNEESKSGTVADSVRLCRVSGSGCSCSDFTYNGLPCKHIYFLASVLVDLKKRESLEI